MLRDVLDALDGREEATAIWILAFAALALVFARSGVAAVLNALANARLFLPLLASALYATGAVSGLHELGLWESTSLKITVFWYLGTALPLFFNSNRALTDTDYLGTVARQALRLTALVEFLVNVHSFSIWIELPLVTIVLTLVLMSAVAETQERSAQVARVINGCLTGAGLVLIVFGLAAIAVDHEAIPFEELYIPPLLTFAFLPFLYALALYTLYDSIVARTNWLLRNRPALARTAKRVIVRTGGFNVNKLRLLSQWFVIRLPDVEKDEDVHRLIAEFNRQTAATAPD